jgi:uncharacterized membrane protein
MNVKKRNKRKNKNLPNKLDIDSNSDDFLKIVHPVSRVPRTFGQKAADAITKFAGSWGFIIGFFIFLISWMVVNSVWILFGSAWDSYPFILLNLVLSCVAAIQAPIILMSQNRTGQIDRIRSEYDYAINRRVARETMEIKKQLIKIEKKLRI